jgi:hypothetical protein
LSDAPTPVRMVRVPLGNGKYTMVARQDLPPQLRDSHALSDSGMITQYEPAIHVKESGAVAKFIGWVQRQWLGYKDRPDPADTTEQGAQSSASPSVYQFSLWQQRYERRAVIQECRQSLDDDPRIYKACWMFAYEAVRGGSIITFNDTFRLTAHDSLLLGDGDLADKPMPKMTQATANKVRIIAKDIQKIVNLKLAEWACGTIVEGESFYQAVVSGSPGNARIVDVLRMPTPAMERNTNDADQFVNVEEAFSQVDIMTNEETATFPLWCIHHSKWKNFDGERYGKPEIASIRRPRRLLMLCEDAQARRRIARATKRVHWEFGIQSGGEYITPDVSIIENFKNNNGFKSGIREQFDTTEIGRDTFGFGVKPHDFAGDDHIADIDDLKYLENVVTIGLPTPVALYSGAAQSNQYTLEDQRAEWLKQTNVLSEKMKEVVKWLMDLSLLLQDIVPETVNYNVKFSESNIETPSEMIKRVIDARGAQVGSGRAAVPSPLISSRTALMNVAEHFNVNDIDLEEQAIAQELAEIAQGLIDIENEKNNVSTPDSPSTTGGSNSTKPISTPSRQKAQKAAFGRHAGVKASGKPTPAQATKKYSGVGQTASPFNNVYGQPNDTDYRGIK